MDSVTHGSISVLIGFIFIQFYDVPLWLLLVVMFVFGVLVDYDHVFYYKRKHPEIKLWNLPQLIKLYFKTVDERDEFIYHTWLHEPFGVLVVCGVSSLFFWLINIPELAILASSCYVAHYLVDLISGKMKPLAPFSNKVTIDLKILPANAFTITGIALGTFLIALVIFIAFKP
ncbi:MAG: metal-dependent hydrolase [Candidatus Heimdallarchaeota archaeon]|nr:metal-dependent hydrolase [Candidatus Heimdallarchaeota archaeon]MCK4252923.1 metal-dependent hydrolase [Candidatus Heimdallarchaeota archaeon]